MYGFYDDFARKMIYVAPSICKTVVEKGDKNTDTLSTFSDRGAITQRRLDVIDKIQGHRNVSDCYDFEQLKTVLIDSKILVNVHQSDYEHTFEEIRVLPALMCRTLVISESSPLTDLVPYHSLVIWSDYDSIADTTQRVLDNYTFYYNKIFTPENIELLNSLHSSNCQRVLSKIIK